MQNNASNIPANDSDSPEQAAFILAEQGTLTLVELINASSRLKAAGLKDKTISLYRMWLEKTESPLAYVACFNLGVELGVGGDYVQAEVMYRRALEQNPGLIQARLNLGTSLEHQKRDDEALEQWRMVTEQQNIGEPENRPFQLHALNNMGRLLETKKQYLAALEILEKSFAIDPEQRDVIIHLVHLTQKICKWPIYNPPKGITKQEMINRTSPLAMLAVSDDPALQLSASKHFVEYKFPVSNPEVLAPKEGYRHEKIRIGYLSSDFCMHAVSLLMVELLERHNHDEFEVYGFCWSRDDGTAVRSRVIKAMDQYIKIDAMSDREAADCIRSHEIDIIIDLQGLTSGARPLILSHRPATIQLTYLGFPGATALPWIDYVIADTYLIPPELVPFHTEKPLYMPHCFQSSDSKREVGSTPTRVDNGLPEKAFVFCTFNNNYKYTPEMFAVWMRILKRVPNSVLWLLADNEWAHDNLIKSAKKLGIKKDRLVFASRLPPAGYLARYQLADLFLDTFPFNGGTTANDALFMGLPLLTLSGRTFASRMAGSLLTHLELPELITTDIKEYEEKAVRFAKKPAALKVLKERLKKNKVLGPVFDMPKFVNDYENKLNKALREIEANCAEVDTITMAGEIKVHDENVASESVAASLPLVSILIPSYRPQYFDFALRSAIAQSYEHIEIIISDDCPDDGIKNIVDRYSSVVNIRYERNPNPDGMGYNNCVNCLRLARGEYIKFLFDDDVLMPFNVQYMVDAFLTNASVNPQLVLSERWVIDSKNNYTGIYKLPLSGLNDITDTWVERNMALHRGNALGELSTAMYRSENSFDRDGRPLFAHIDGRDMIMGDVALFINLSRIGRVLYISLPLSCFRNHAGSNSAARESKWFHRLFTDWEVVIEQAHLYGRITHEEAITSLEALEQQNRYRETIVPSLVGHSDGLLNKINRMREQARVQASSQTREQIDGNQKVSVMIPIYNGEKCITETLDSLLRQTLSDFEVICVDDCSTDASLSVLKIVAAKDARIRVFQTPFNKGTAARVLNYSLQFIQGNYIVYSSQDDLFSEDWLEKIRSRAIDTGADAVIPDLVFYHANDSTKNRTLCGLHGDRSVVLSNREAVLYSLNWEIPGNAIWNANLVKKKGFDNFELNSLELSTRVFFLNCNKVAFSEGTFYYRQDNELAVTKKMSHKTFDYPFTQYRLYQLLKENGFSAEIVHREALKVISLLNHYRQWLVNHRSDFTENEAEKAEFLIRQCDDCLKADPMFAVIFE